MSDTTRGPQLCLCSFVSKGQTHTKQMESLFMAMQNSPISPYTPSPFIFYSIYCYPMRWTWWKRPQ